MKPIHLSLLLPLVTQPATVFLARAWLHSPKVPRLTRVDRYFGESYPFSILDTQNLTHLTLPYSLADIAHFARTVDLPFDQTGRSSPGSAVHWIPSIPSSPC
jgi:hypothetical protein